MQCRQAAVETAHFCGVCLGLCQRPAVSAIDIHPSARSESAVGSGSTANARSACCRLAFEGGRLNSGVNSNLLKPCGRTCHPHDQTQGIGGVASAAVPPPPLQEKQDLC